MSLDFPSNIRSDSLDSMEVDVPLNKRQKLFSSFSNKNNYAAQGQSNGFSVNASKNQGCLTSKMNHKLHDTSMTSLKS